MSNSTTYDVIVVGAGVIGCSIAHALTTAGLKTALLDREHVGAGASGANFGMVQSNDVELKSSIPMVKASKAKFEHLEAELDMSVGLRRIASLRLLTSEQQWKFSEERSKVLPPNGIPYEFVPPHRIPEIEPLVDPKHLFGATYAPEQGQLNPMLLMWAYLRRAIANGLALHTFTEVTGFEIESGKIRGVRTNRGVLSAGVVVLATAAWTRQLGKLLDRDWNVHTFRASAMVSEPIYDLQLNTILTSADHVEMQVISPDDVEVTVMALSQTPSNHFLMAQADRPGDIVDSQISHAAPKTIATMAGRFIPVLRKARVMRAWTAPTTYTDDGCPLLGPISDIEGLILATAYRSSIIHAPLAGEIVSQLITSSTACNLIDLTPFTPERQMQVVDPFYSVKSKKIFISE